MTQVAIPTWQERWQPGDHGGGTRSRDIAMQSEIDDLRAALQAAPAHAAVLTRESIADDIAIACMNGDLPDNMEHLSDWIRAGAIPDQPPAQPVNQVLVDALKEAATSLETISRLAGRTHYVGNDGERVETYMGHPDQVRGYAASRAGVASAALAQAQDQYDHIPDAGKMVAATPSSELRAAAQAVVDRWHSPLWKDLPHTGEFIKRLSDALEDQGNPAPSTDIPPGIYYVSPSGKFIPHHCAAPSTAGERAEVIEALNRACRGGLDCTCTLHRAVALLQSPALPVGKLTPEQIEWVARGLIAEGKWSNQNFARAILAAARSQPVREPIYSLDADPQGIRARVVSAVQGALLLGARNENKPPEGHWLTEIWDAARAEGSLTETELEICRQWFNNVQDVNGGYLTPADYLLAEKLYTRLGMRIPSSITGITKNGGHPAETETPHV